MNQDHSHWKDRHPKTLMKWVHIEIKLINLLWVILLTVEGVRQSLTLLVSVLEVILCLSRKLNSTFECKIMGLFIGYHQMKKDIHIIILLKNWRNLLPLFVLLKRIPAIKVCKHFLYSIYCRFCSKWSKPCENSRSSSTLFKR